MLRYIGIISLSLIIVSCSLKHGTAALYNEISAKKLKKETNVYLEFNPEKWVPEVYDEYAHEVDQISFPNYQNILMEQLQDNRVRCLDAPARYRIKVYEIRFTEFTEQDCVMNESAGYQECFDINKLGVEISFVMTDTQTGQSMDDKVRADENTRVKQDLVFKHYKESTLITPYANMMKRLMGRMANRFTNFIRRLD